jgi:hypothetical protein
MSQYKVLYDAINEPTLALEKKKKKKKMTIWSACLHADIHTVREFLTNKKAYANDTNIHGNSPLYYTVQAARKYSGDLKKLAICVRIAILLLHGGGRRETADIHAINLIGETPLYLACKYSPIMAALFKKYIKWRNETTKEEYEYLLKARAAGLEREHERKILKQEWDLQIDRQKNEAKLKRDQKYLKQVTKKIKRQDYGLEKLKQKRPMTATSSRRTGRSNTKKWRNGWNKKDIFLHNTRYKYTTDQKIMEWNKHIRVRDRLDLMKLKTVEAYDKRKAESIKKRLYRIEREKHYRQEIVAYYRKRPCSSHNRDKFSRYALENIHRVEEHRRVLNSKPIAKPEPQEEDGMNKAKDLRTRVPAGFFRLDKESDIKEAFNVLAGGKRYIDKNKLIQILSTNGDALNLQEAFDMLERIEGFRLSNSTKNIDYETFVETMLWLSRNEDLKDSTTISKINKSMQYVDW